MRVVKSGCLEQERVESFVESINGKLFFQSYKYFTFLRNYLDAEDYSLACVDGNEKVTGYFPLLGKNGPYGLVVNSLPYYGSNGGLFYRDAETAGLLATAYNSLVSDGSVLASTVITSPFETNIDFYRDNLSFNASDMRVGQLSPLRFGDEEDIMPSYHQKTRNMVRKAIKSNVEVVCDNGDMQFIYDCHLSNMQGIGGKAKDWTFFQQVESFFEPDIDYDIFVAYIGSQRVAGLLVFYYGDVIEYFTPVVVKEFRDKQGLSAIIYSLFKKTMSKYKFLNWGGTWPEQKGVYRFKSRWGAVDKPYYYFTQLNDESVHSVDKSHLLNEYKNFFVYPFK